MSEVWWGGPALASLICCCAFLLLWLDRRDARNAAVVGLVALLGAAGAAGTVLLVTPSLSQRTVLGSLDVAPRALLVLAVPCAVGVVWWWAVLVLLSRFGPLEFPLDGVLVGSCLGAVAGAASQLLSVRVGTALPSVEWSHAILATAVGGSLVGLHVGAARLWAGAVARAWRHVAGVATGLTGCCALLAPLVLAGDGAGTWLRVSCLAAGAIALGLVVWGAMRWERVVVRAELGGEAAAGVVPAWVVNIVPHYFRRVRSAWWERRDERRALILLLTTLAFRKRRLASLEPEQARVFALEVGRLRQRVRALLVGADAAAEAEVQGHI